MAEAIDAVGGGAATGDVDGGGDTGATDKPLPGSAEESELEERGPSEVSKPKLQSQQRPEQASQKLKLDVKVDGKNIAKEFTADELKVWVQKGMAFDRRSQELRHGIDKNKIIVQHLEGGPEGIRALIEAAGQDPREVARKWLAEEAQLELMEPKDREIYELKRRLEGEEQAKLSEKEQLKAKLAQAEQAKAVESAKQLTMEAIKLAKLPQNWETAYEVAVVADSMVQAGLEPDPESLAIETKRRLDGFTTNYLEGLSKIENDAEFLERVPKEFSARLLKAHLNKARGRDSNFSGQSEERVVTPKPPVSGYLTMEDIQKRIRGG